MISVTAVLPSVMVLVTPGIRPGPSLCFAPLVIVLVTPGKRKERAREPRAIRLYNIIIIIIMRL